jgi:hypothetical protein
MARIADYMHRTGTGKIKIPTPDIDGNEVFVFVSASR